MKLSRGVLISLALSSGAAWAQVAEPGFRQQGLSDQSLQFSPLDAALDGGILGLLITRSDGVVIAERNADVRLMPASNQKLYSVIYALAKLSADTTFTTQISVTRDKWTIQTPFSGTISLQDWKNLIELAKKSSLSGNPKLVEVQQLFRVGVPDGWELDDLGSSYAAPIQSLSFDLGRFQLKANKGFVATFPKEFGIKVSQNSLSNSNDEGLKYNYFEKTLEQVGLLKAQSGNLQQIALPYPDVAAAKLLAPRIKFTSFDGIVTPAPKSQIVATYTSPNVGILAGMCLQPSDNQLAESLLILAAATEGPLGKNPHNTATTRISKWLNTIGIAPSEARPQDGSGLSRHNLTSPRAISKLLNWSKTQPWFPILELAMARPGVGTLKSRLAGTSFRGKTGTLDVVVGLSGFVTSKSGENFTFSCLVNHANGSSSEVRNAVDNFVRTLENTGSLGQNLAYPNNDERILAEVFPN